MRFYTKQHRYSCEINLHAFILGHSLYMKAIPVCRQAGTAARRRTTGQSRYQSQTPDPH
jgi:hypothetical protein